MQRRGYILRITLPVLLLSYRDSLIACCETITKNDYTMGLPTKSDGPSGDHAIAGAASGFITRLLCQPLDVIKIRFQLQVEPISHGERASKYRSVLHAVKVIVAEEKIFALWKGHVPAQLLSIVYGTGQFYSYNQLKKFSDTVPTLFGWNKSVNFISGAAAGSFATIISFPFDTVRTRLVAQSSNNKIYKGIFHPYITILKTESPRSFFRGLLPTLIQIAPHTGLQFMFYNILTDVYKSFSLDVKTNMSNSIIAGSGAGFLAKTMVYPFDLARKRLQIQGFEHGRKGFGKFFSCCGLVDCFVATVRKEGVRGLFKGLVPSQIKATVTTALHFTAYEQVLLILKAIRD